MATDATKEPTPEEIKAAAEAEKTAQIKELLKRFGLKSAAVDKKGNVHFDEAFIKKLPANSFTTIEA